LEVLVTAVQSVTNDLGTLFLRVLLLYALAGLGILVSVAYSARQLWQLKSLWAAAE
jgi:hypothetical protein